MECGLDDVFTDKSPSCPSINSSSNDPDLHPESDGAKDSEGDDIQNVILFMSYSTRNEVTKFNIGDGGMFSGSDTDYLSED